MNHSEWQDEYRGAVEVVTSALSISPPPGFLLPCSCISLSSNPEDMYTNTYYPQSPVMAPVYHRLAPSLLWLEAGLVAVVGLDLQAYRMPGTLSMKHPQIQPLGNYLHS
jgi:hypothetical protein